MEDATKGSEAVIHGMFQNADSTLCGQVDHLDTVTMIGRVINCAACMIEVQKIREHHGHENMTPYPRHVRHHDKVEQQEGADMAAAIRDEVHKRGSAEAYTRMIQWLKVQASAANSPDAKAAYIESHNAALAMKDGRA